MLVVGDASTLKVHLHTDEPEPARRRVFAQAGEVSHLDVADMRAQVAERDERLDVAAELAAISTGGSDRAVEIHRGSNGALVSTPAPRRDLRCGAVAVVNGEGLSEMFHELGVQTIDGGPTLNPSTYDLLAGIHDVPAEEVVLLTNSANVIMAAEHAAKLSDKQVLVAPTTSQQAGLSAAVALVAGALAGGERAGAQRGARARTHRRGRACRPR